MRYAYRLSDGTEIRQKLDAEAVAKLTAGGVSLAILRRRHYARGAEPHVGEYTDGEHATMLADGWELLKVLADGEDIKPPAPPRPPRRISKLKLRRAFISRGKQATFRAWIKSNPDLEDQYADCQYLDESDTVFGQALGNVKTVLSLTDEQAEALLEACRA